MTDLCSHLIAHTDAGHGWEGAEAVALTALILSGIAQSTPSGMRFTGNTQCLIVQYLSGMRPEEDT